MVLSDVVQIIAIVFGLIVLVIVCNLFKSRPRPEALTEDQLDEIRIRRESTKEAAIEEKLQRLKERARVHRQNRLVLTARKETGRLIHRAQEQWDARGKSIYGDAWDTPDDENLPLRTLLNLPKEEIECIRKEARGLVSDRTGSGMFSMLKQAGHPLSTSTREEASQADDDHSRLVRNDVNDEQRAMTASARRGLPCSLPPTDAPFVDVRFIRGPTPSPVVPELDFTRLATNIGNFPVAPLRMKNPRFVGKALMGGERSREEHRGTLTEQSRHLYRQRHTDGPAIGAAAAPSTFDAIVADTDSSLKLGGRIVAASWQQPGLAHPRPPAVPAPASQKKKSANSFGRESLSARIARLAGGSSSQRVVPWNLV